VTSDSCSCQADARQGGGWTEAVQPCNTLVTRKCQVREKEVLGTGV
jgi:hypothetical protein